MGDIVKKIVIPVILTVILSGMVFGGLLLKTTNKNFMEDPLFYKSLAQELVKQEDWAKAAAAYEEYLFMQDDFAARSNLAVIYNTLRDYESAVFHLRLLIQQAPEKAEYHYDLAVNLVDVYRTGGSPELLLEGLAEYKIAENLTPGYANAAQNIETIENILA